jgi:hypothetical protein
MLAMPHCQNERLLVLIEPMRIRRLHRKAARTYLKIEGGSRSAIKGG